MNLETFLVEWKPSSSPLSGGVSIDLETFLVEWKLDYLHRELVTVHHLETFLVEWKLVLVPADVLSHLALKPS